MSTLLAFALTAAVAIQVPHPVTQDQGDAKYYFLLGRYLEGAGKVDDAVAALRRAIDLEPKSAEAFLGLLNSLNVEDNKDDVGSRFAKLELAVDTVNHVVLASLAGRGPRPDVDR